MTTKIVDFVRRTGSATSAMRQIVVVQGEGKNAVETVLKTPIEKIEWGTAFRNGASHVPIEQYAFRVGVKTVERFADATALVLKRHNVTVAGVLEDHQAYVQKAIAILNGTEELKLLSEVPTEAKPAVLEKAA